MVGVIGFEFQDSIPVFVWRGLLKYYRTNHSSAELSERQIYTERLSDCVPGKRAQIVQHEWTVVPLMRAVSCCKAART